jgi:hypothetical protein
MSLLYRRAASLFKDIRRGKVSMKSIKKSNEESDENSMLKKARTLAIKCLSFQKVLEDIMKEANLSSNEEFDVDESILYIMIFEILFGKGKIDGGGEVKRLIAPHLPKCIEIRNKLMEGKTDYHELLSKDIRLSMELPLYLRISAKLVTNINHAIEYLQEKYPIMKIEIDDLIPTLLKVSNPLTARFAGNNDDWVKQGKNKGTNTLQCM